MFVPSFAGVVCSADYSSKMMFTHQRSTPQLKPSTIKCCFSLAEHIMHIVIWEAMKTWTGAGMNHTAGCGKLPLTLHPTQFLMNWEAVKLFLEVNYRLWLHKTLSKHEESFLTQLLKSCFQCLMGIIVNALGFDLRCLFGVTGIINALISFSLISWVLHTNITHMGWILPSCFYLARWLCCVLEHGFYFPYCSISLLWKVFEQLFLNFILYNANHLFLSLGMIFGFFHSFCEWFEFLGGVSAF